MKKDLNSLRHLFCRIYMLYFFYKRRLCLLSALFAVVVGLFIRVRPWIIVLWLQEYSQGTKILTFAFWLLVNIWSSRNWSCCTGCGWHNTPNEIKIGMFSKTREFRTANKRQYTQCDRWSVYLMASMTDGGAYKSQWEEALWENMEFKERSKLQPITCQHCKVADFHILRLCEKLRLASRTYCGILCKQKCSFAPKRTHQIRFHLKCI